MKRNTTVFVVFLLALAACAQRASAQFIGYTSPQSAQQKVFSGQTTAQTTPVATVSCTPVNGTPCGIPNIGQTVHFLTYTVGGGGAATIQIRLEGSFDGSTWITISDDATDLTGGEVVGVGYYPAVRANLVTCAGCGGAVAVTANYSGVSSSPAVPYGFYNPSQQVRKVVFTNQSVAGGFVTATGVAAPYGSTAGFILVTGTIVNGSSVSIVGHVGQVSLSGLLTCNTVNGLSTDICFVPASPANNVDVTFTGNGSTVSLYYIFYPPGQAGPASAQPPGTVNKESTSAVNTAVSQTITANTGQRAHLYSVNARCSAGTAQLTVSDGGTQAWSTAATEVGTTTFKFQWNPALANSWTASNNLVVTLSTCGAGNTGTLDVQASVF